MSDAQSEPASVEIDPSVFRKVLGHFPTGVTVVASQVGDRQLGLAIGSFFSVSLKWPIDSICLSIAHTARSAMPV